ncbi:hypothetical protein BSKO_03076 [Bryopsis sp. KO-2023]|nr:hypothetical protein BSKO_03076 [Bryopsis sp. KO-2023]
MGKVHVCVDFVSPHEDNRIFVYDVLVGLPSMMFLLFLALNFRRSLKKLRQSGSEIMSTYFAFLWGVTTLNILRCLVQLAQTEETGRSDLWNVLWLFNRFGTSLLEISVVVFLLQGYTGRQALVRTLGISGVLAGLEALIEVIYIFGFNIPLFLYDNRGIHADMSWSKWSFWLVHHLIYGIVYLAILLVPYTQWREILPAKPSFYRYVSLLFVFSLTTVLGSILIGALVNAGYCVYGMASFLYYAGYPPLLYWTFLSEFFADQEMELDSYYAEMRDAGYFEDDSFRM